MQYYVIARTFYAAGGSEVACCGMWVQKRLFRCVALVALAVLQLLLLRNKHDSDGVRDCVQIT
jgi:hypothetical protein